MAIKGYIKSLFADREKTIPLFPITKTKAVINDDGKKLDELLGDAIFMGDDADKATGYINADTLGGVPASQYMQKGDIGPTDSAVPKAGFIYPLATPEAPDGFLLCDGKAYSRADYPELFDAIGTYYGEGDGSTTFNVPNLQTRVPVGAGSGYALGDVGGEAEHALTVDEMPAHKHIYTLSGGSLTDGTGHADWSQGAHQEWSTQATGGNQPHNNMQPYTVVNYIIATGKGSNVNVRDVVTGAQAVPLEPEYGGTGVTSLAELMLMVYPVGSIYVSSNPTSPTELFGGVWEAITDVVIVGAGGKYDVNSTGGSETHVLTVGEMPNHNHAFTDTGRMLMWDSDCSPLYDPSSYNSTDGNVQTTWNTMTAYSGGGAAHNNMQPYIAKYIWERVG